MNKEKKTLLVVFGILAVAVVASGLFLLRPQSGSALLATVQVGDQVITTIDLATAEDGTLSIEESTGLPITFEVKEHAIRFAHSNCPDKVCVNSGYLSRDMDIASCLPNKTILTVEAVD